MKTKQLHFVIVFAAPNNSRTYNYFSDTMIDWKQWLEWAESEPDCVVAEACSLACVLP